MLTPRLYQRESVDALYDYWQQGGGNGLLVLPTGAGKSLVIATICQELLSSWRTLRIGIVTHVQELIAQNAQELISAWPQAPVGIYSAGLGRRDAHAQVVFMGIQSVHKKTDILGKFDIIIVDEAHLIPRDAATMYGRFFARLRDVVPDMRIIGLTATPFRLDSGRLDRGDERLFDDVVYEANVRDLIEQGYLSRLISKATLSQIDTSKLHVRNGEFIEAEMAAAASSIVGAAVSEIVNVGQDRRGWLAFCSGVPHAEQVRDEIRKYGISCETVVGATPKGERARIIAAYKRREIRCLTSVGVLTTGFNAPHVDLLAMLRPTLSTGLYVQMVGRGFRLADGKDDCLVLDFAGNVRRHGPVDDPKPKRQGGGKGKDDDQIKVKEDDIRAKECPECKFIVSLATMHCPHCGHEWPKPAASHQAEAEAVAILSTEVVPPRWLDVGNVRYALHQKQGVPDSVAANFVCGIKVYRQWLCFGHPKRTPRVKASEFWRLAGGDLPVPTTAEEALDRQGELRRVTAIMVKASGQYPEVINHQFEPRANAEAAE